MSEVVGTVSAIRRYPIKSMLGEDLDAAVLGQGGLVGDRVYALVDEETGKVVSVKRPKRWRRMFELTACTLDDGSVRVSFPGDEAVAVGDPKLTARLGEFLGRPVSVTDSPPPDAAYDEAWTRDLKAGADPYFDIPTYVVDGEEMIDGGGFMKAHGNFFDFGAIHLLTTGTTRQLERHAPQFRFDVRRFRPNILVETDDEGFVESGWQARTLEIGGARLQVSFTVPRCVLTTLAQGDLPADRGVLRAITEANSVDVLHSGTAYPCVGVYADVLSEGPIRRGDPVRLLE
jgi:uncharacterized protein YcbX